MARLGAVTKVTVRMGIAGIRGIGCGAHRGAGFSRRHTRAASWAVSAAFTFLLKIEGYGGGGRPFFLSTAVSSCPSVILSLFALRSAILRRSLGRLPFLSVSLSFPTPSPPPVFPFLQRGDTCHTGTAEANDTPVGARVSPAVHAPKQ